MRWPAFLKRTVVRTVMVAEADIKCQYCDLKILPGEGFDVRVHTHLFSPDPPKSVYGHVNLFVCINRLRGNADVVGAAEAMMREAERRA